MKLNNAYYNGIITTIVSSALIISIFRFRFGIKWWESREYIFYFIPVWVAIFTYVSYKTTKKYNELKKTYLPEKKSFSDSELEQRKREWKKQLRWEKSKYLLYVARGCAIAFPGVLLAYLDNSEYLIVSITTLLIIVVLGIASYIGHRWLKTKCELET